MITEDEIYKLMFYGRQIQMGGIGATVFLQKSPTEALRETVNRLNPKMKIEDINEKEWEITFELDLQ